MTPQAQEYRTIQLTQGQFTIVDAADYEWLSQWKWCADWSNMTKSYYAIRGQTTGFKVSEGVKMHRVILGLKRGDGKLSDHRNGDTLDNRRENLRIATKSTNAMNSRISSNNTSGFKGVGRDRGRWRAFATVNYRRIHIGYFSTPEEAYAARCAAIVHLHGEFARTK